MPLSKPSLAVQSWTENMALQWRVSIPEVENQSRIQCTSNSGIQKKKRLGEIKESKTEAKRKRSYTKINLFVAAALFLRLIHRSRLWLKVPLHIALFWAHPKIKVKTAVSNLPQAIPQKLKDTK